MGGGLTQLGAYYTGLGKINRNCLLVGKFASHDIATFKRQEIQTELQK